MAIDCSLCGQYEIGQGLYEELLQLPSGDWQIDRIREALERATQPSRISRAVTNIVEVEPLGKRLTKLEKWSLRKRAEKGGREVSGQITRRR